MTRDLLTGVAELLSALDTNSMMVFVVLCALALGAMALYVAILALKK